METAITNLYQKISSFGKGFNNNNCFGIKTFEGYKHKHRVWQKSLLYRLELCNHFYEVLRQIKYTHLFSEKEDAPKNDEIVNNNIKYNYQGNSECEFVFNMVLDGFLINLSSILDIFSTIANSLFYDVQGYVGFRDLFKKCQNNSNEFEVIITSNFHMRVRDNGEHIIIGQPQATWINKFRELRNILIHDKALYPNIGDLSIDTNTENSTPGIEYKIPKDFFIGLSSGVDYDIKTYCELLLDKSRTFLRDSFTQMNSLITPHIKIPRCSRKIPSSDDKSISPFAQSSGSQGS